jgi:hypothetical protein
MSATDETPRPHRMTLSEVVERLTEQRSSSPHLPTFEVASKPPTAEQTKQGITAVYQWSASVPVCPEFPTADDAFRAARRYADELREAYPPDVKQNGKP